jgi:D-alanyl-D-alanine carboxypeptidase/D-alanyl-D-alanine-endopeptidase (penicillin-binding protein 4)
MSTLIPRTGIFLFILTLCSASLAAAPAAVPVTVARALASAGITLSNVGIWVQPVDGTTPTLALNDQQAMNPASVMKLVTSFAALEALGPAHTWTTRVATRGQHTGRVLHGDLHLVGGGDPVLGYERLWKMLRKVREMGITMIEGDIVLDGSVLRLPNHDPYAFDGKGLRPYNSGPHGLLLHFNTLHLSLTPPANAGRLVTVTPHPPLKGLTIKNTIQGTNGACGVWYHGLDAALESAPEGVKLVLGGTLPLSCGAREWASTPLSAEEYGAALVAGLWEEIGGSLGGSVRSGSTPATATTLVSETSPALGEIVREMNKWSSNVIARQLLAALGANRAADAVAAGVVAATAQLARAGIPTEGLVIENGSGLSRIARIRAASLGKLLLTAWQRPYMPEFIASLPIAGVDGTAQRRLNTSPANGHAHIKTGTINNVRAMAGYVLDRNGRRHAVVMMVNDPAASASKGAQDALLEWIWQARIWQAR